MRAVLSWIDKVLDEQGNEHAIYDLDYKPDGSELLVAAGTQVLVYDGVEGTLLQGLKGHKDMVHTVCFSASGERFASGSADRCVIIWTEQHEGILKYQHNDGIQSLRFHPISTILLSCATSDFGIWSAEVKTVNKIRSSARICCSTWNRDGSLMAVGCANGTVTIRNTNMDEIGKIERPGEAVWALKFNPNRVDEAMIQTTEDRENIFNINQDILAVADWNQNLSFYDKTGNQMGKDRPLNYDPMCMDYFNLGDFLVLAGSNKQVSLHTREGVRLGTVCDMESWIWSCKTKPNSQYVAIGCNDGSIACYQMIFSTVHGLHKDRYAYRENMTDVIVQDLAKDLRVRIRCKDLVKKVAVYNNRLAIQLSDRVHIYQQISGDQEGESLQYRTLEKIHESFECSLLVVCAKNLILCQEKRLQCFDFRGLKVREWVLDALIRYIKVIGGPTGREAILIGLKNGKVLKIFVDNPFPVELLQIKSAVRCLDLSLNRTRVAVVDEHGVCFVFDLTNADLLFQEPNANSVAWNTEFQDLLCFSGGGILSIKARDFITHQQKMPGFVVGFSGKQVFCLHLYTMSSMEVPLSNQLYQYMEKNLFSSAYELACLGATETDWEILAMEAMQQMDLLTAKKAFHRVRNIRLLELIASIEERKKQGVTNNQAFLADMLAYQKRFKEAAHLYQQAGMEQSALEMFTELRMFDQAQDILSNASGETKNTLILKKADWANSSNEPRQAAEMYITAGEYSKAIKIMVEHNWTDMLISLARKLDNNQVDHLRHIAESLSKSKEYALAAEVYQMMNDMSALVKMHIAGLQWEDAFVIAERNPNLRDEVYLPYARWLAENDRFEDAQNAYHKAGHDAEALHVLEQLTHNAVVETRFNDAGYYYWLLSMQYLDKSAENVENEKTYLVKFEEAQRFADIYYAYHAVHRYMAEPFTSYAPDALLNISRFLLHAIGNEPPERVSRVCTLFTLAKQGKALGAYKLARYAYERLQKLRAPARFQQRIELGALQIRAKPFSDAEELLPMCYTCSTSNPLLNSNGNVCLHCKTPFVFSFVSFDILPVVGFELEGGLSDEEALSLLQAEPPLDDTQFNDPFTKAMKSDNNSRVRIVADRNTLLNLNKTEILVCQWPKPLNNIYYRNMIPEISVTKCDSCNRLFQTDDYELAVLQEGMCPFCRKARQKKNVNYQDDIDMDY